MKKLKWYIVSKEYVKYLKEFDDKVEDIDYKENLKPYIGIVLNINEFDYYIPISSPKEKHYKMKESMDFIKIINKKGNILGVLNLNNMIPIIKNELEVLRYDELDNFRQFTNEQQMRNYLTLLVTELRIINKNAEKIYTNAKKNI